MKSRKATRPQRALRFGGETSQTLGNVEQEVRFNRCNADSFGTQARDVKVVYEAPAQPFPWRSEDHRWHDYMQSLALILSDHDGRPVHGHSTTTRQAII